MTAKKGMGVQWCQTTVVLREDILVQAQASGLDINDICNRALAGAAGIDYRPQEPAGAIPAAPVIVAQNGALSPGETVPSAVTRPAPPVGIHPVINADDPHSPVAVKLVPRPPASKQPAVLPGRVTPQDKTEAHPVPEPAPASPKTRKTDTRPGRKGSAKESPIRRFVAEVISRDDGQETPVPKDLLYQTFTRWCREHKVTPVPDRRAVTIALKNQFALTEKTVGGEPCWMNIRLK